VVRSCFSIRLFLRGTRGIPGLGHGISDMDESGCHAAARLRTTLCASQQPSGPVFRHNTICSPALPLLAQQIHPTLHNRRRLIVPDLRTVFWLTNKLFGHNCFPDLLVRHLAEKEALGDGLHRRVRRSDSHYTAGIQGPFRKHYWPGNRGEFPPDTSTNFGGCLDDLP